MTENEIITFLKSIKFCNGFKNAELKELAGKLRLQSFSAKEQVLSEGDSKDFINHFYIVVKGDVSISKQHENKGQICNLLINILKAGDCFGEIAMIQDDKTRTATVKCLTDAVFLIIDRRNFLEFYKSSWQMAHNFNKIFIKYLNHSNNVSRYVVFSSRNATARLMYMIDFLNSKYGTIDKNDLCQIDLPFNTSNIAEFLSWKQQMYSRCKLELENCGMITVDTRSIKIHNYSNFKAALYK